MERGKKIKKSFFLPQRQHLLLNFYPFFQTMLMVWGSSCIFNAKLTGVSYCTLKKVIRVLTLCNSFVTPKEKINFTIFLTSDQKKHQKNSDWKITSITSSLCQSLEIELSKNHQALSELPTDKKVTNQDFLITCVFINISFEHHQQNNLTLMHTKHRISATDLTCFRVITLYQQTTDYI